MPAVEFPDVEAMCLTFAKTKTTAMVGTKVKNPRPVRYARIWRTGGGSLNRVLEQVQITITCGAASGSVEALAIARDLRSAFLNEYTQMPLVRGVEEVSGPYADPDPDTAESRYSMTFILMVRGKR